VRDALHTRLADALVSGGYLVVGASQRVVDPRSLDLTSRSRSSIARPDHGGVGEAGTPGTPTPRSGRAGDRRVERPPARGRPGPRNARERIRRSNVCPEPLARPQASILHRSRSGIREITPCGGSRCDSRATIGSRPLGLEPGGRLLGRMSDRASIPRPLVCASQGKGKATRMTRCCRTASPRKGSIMGFQR
jgi:hypothetical protein